MDFGVEEKQGWMYKRGKQSKMDPNPHWKKRWFELDIYSRQLKYYKHQNVVSTKGEIPLSNAVVRVLRPTDKTYRPRAFAIKGPLAKREYFLQAETARDLELWIKAIEDAVRYLTEETRKKEMKDTFIGMTDLSPDARLKPLSDPANAGRFDGDFYGDEKAFDLDLSLPTRLETSFAKRMSTWRSVASLRGYSDHELVVETRTHERDMVPETTCLAARRAAVVDADCAFVATGNTSRGPHTPAVHFFHPNISPREVLKTDPMRVDVGSTTCCTDLSWRENNLLCGTLDGALRLYTVGVMPEGVSTVHQTTLGDRKKDESKRKIADFGEWCASPRVSQCEINPKKTNHALAVSGCEFSLWDLEKSQEPLFMAGGSSDALFSCSWDVNRGSMFLIAGQSRSLKILDARKLNDLNKSAVWKVAEAHDRRITDVAFSPLIKWWLASASADGHVKVWDLRYADTPIFTLSSHLSAVNRVAWSHAHCEMLASAGVDRTLRLWNLRTPPHHLVHTQDDFSTEVVGVDFSAAHPLRVHGVSASGEAIELTMTEEFLSPFVQHRFRRPEETRRTNIDSGTRGNSISGVAATNNGHPPPSKFKFSGSTHQAQGTPHTIQASYSIHSRPQSSHMQSGFGSPAPLVTPGSYPSRIATPSSKEGKHARGQKGQGKGAGEASLQSQGHVSDEDITSERKVEHYLYTRNFKLAFKLISELAGKYYQAKMNKRAIDLLKLASGSLFRNLQQQQNPRKGVDIARFLSDVAYYIPPDGIRLNSPSDEDFKLIQLLKTRIALRTLIENRACGKLIDIKEEIVKQLSENGDAFSARTLDDMVATILPENFLAGFSFAMTLGTKLKEKGTFAKNFVLIARRLFFPTIFHGGRVVNVEAEADEGNPRPKQDEPSRMISSDDIDPVDTAEKTAVAMTSTNATGVEPDAKNSRVAAALSNPNVDLGDSRQNLGLDLDDPNVPAEAAASHDMKAMDRKLQRELRNPLIVLPQLKLVNEVHMALSRAFSKSEGDANDTSAPATTLYKPAEVVISVVEKYREEKDAPPQRILPAMVHRLYVNALIQRNKLDKVFVYTTQLSQAIKGWRFAVLLDELARDVAFPKLKQFFDLALLQNRRRPWECQRVVQASLMLLRILHSCEHLPQNLNRAAPSFMDRFTRNLKKALYEVFLNPRYDGSQTLEGIMEINKARAVGKVDAKRDAIDLVDYLKQQVMKIREHGRGHQPLHPDKVVAFRDMLDSVETGVHDGSLGNSSRRPSSQSQVRSQTSLSENRSLSRSGTTSTDPKYPPRTRERRTRNLEDVPEKASDGT